MSSLGSEFLAHSASKSGRSDDVPSHLADVARRAAEHARAFDAADEARLAGLLHDLGKYGARFQDRLKGRTSGVDHWSPGAWAAITRFKLDGIAAALAIQGHHIGLQKADNDSLRGLDLVQLAKQHPLNLKLSEQTADIAILLNRLDADGLPLPASLPDSILDYKTARKVSAAAMLDVRMVFSALVDADFIETEAHFQAGPDGKKRCRPDGPPLEPERALSILQSQLEDLAQRTSAAPTILRLRADLLQGCLHAASEAQGLFTLTAPTGAGKTLGMLAFALKHAVRYNLRRVIVVIPYLSIIEQTIEVFRSVFSPPDFPDEYMLEDHSLAGTRGEREDSDGGISEEEYRRRLLAENWDAPIIVTTSVQLLESLFANRPSACRKLHRLAKSVMMFDEVQTLPTQVIVPTLATLSRLAERYGATIVFSTATQPAFTHLHEAVAKFCATGWQPREIVPSELNLFGRARRTRVQWPDPQQRVSWTALADELAEHERVLCVVNLKRHAHMLYDELCSRVPEGLFHLSTNMCPAHRRVVLGEVRARLEKGEPCRLVSTQCIEAGVDVDFPTVYRALGPLDSIAQAAGRCNRNGRAEVGLVRVFVPKDDRLYPGGAYQQATAVTGIVLKKHSTDQIDINDPQVFTEYYRDLYDLSQPDQQNQELREAVMAQDFVDVAHRYRMIERDGINIVVPYDLAVFEQLVELARRNGLTRQWIARARPYAVGVFRPGLHDPLGDHIEPVPLRNREYSDDWFIYLRKEHYDSAKGLVPPTWDCLIA